jgi:hypothetical protein
MSERTVPHKVAVGVGDIVHFQLPDNVRHAGECRAAIVTRVVNIETQLIDCQVLPAHGDDFTATTAHIHTPLWHPKECCPRPFHIYIDVPPEGADVPVRLALSMHEEG